ncbi:NAD(P)/FAD-dependent oxidoreductase [bacterium]|nr:NAD(P)/FAD-dependent oxidoreductase [bacterium]
MNTAYDIIVVGGGPAGSMAALEAAKGGASVIMLEKDREIGVPVRCAEGVSQAGLKLVMGFVKPGWISQKITKAQLIAPDGTAVDVGTAGQVGYILHRKLFDYDLASMAGEAGVNILTRAYVYDIIRESGNIAGVRAEHLDRKIEFRSRLVIGADGVESRLGRRAGLKTRTKPKDMDTCAQMTLADIDIDPETIVIYFGNQVAPGGYAWVFPKGPRMANVGLGVSGKYSAEMKPIAYLHQFVDKHFPGAKILTLVAGGVPCVDTLKHIVADGLMLVGDAAHQVNPMTGGGILNGMIAGKIAGRVAADAIRKGDVSEKQLSPYVKEWHKTEGKNNERSYRIQQVVNKFSDKDLNKIAQTVNGIPLKNRSIMQIFKTALLKHPKLILEAAKVYGGV